MSDDEQLTSDYKVILTYFTDCDEYTPTLLVTVCTNANGSGHSLGVGTR